MQNWFQLYKVSVVETYICDNYIDDFMKIEFLIIPE